MNKMYYKVLFIGVMMFTLWSCTGNNNDAYQQQVPVTQEQSPLLSSRISPMPRLLVLNPITITAAWNMTSI